MEPGLSGNTLEIKGFPDQFLFRVHNHLGDAICILCGIQRYILANNIKKTVKVSGSQVFLDLLNLFTFPNISYGNSTTHEYSDYLWPPDAFSDPMLDHLAFNLANKFGGSRGSDNYIPKLKKNIEPIKKYDVLYQLDGRSSGTLPRETLEKIVALHGSGAAIGGKDTHKYLGDGFNYIFGNIESMISYLLGCKKFVGADSGVAHLCGILGVKGHVYPGPFVAYDGIKRMFSCYSSLEVHDSKSVPLVNGNNSMNAFACVTDEGYFKGFWALANSVYAYHKNEIKFYLFGRNLSSKYIEAVKSHPLNIEYIDTKDLTYGSIGAWECKQQVFAHLLPKVKCVFLLDADLVLLSRMDDVFQMANEGKIVSSRDGTSMMHYGRDYSSYGNIVGKSAPYFNSGCVCIDVRKHWDLAGLWAFASKYGSYSPGNGEPLKLQGWGDQGVLNAIAVLLNKESSVFLFDQEEWCDSGSRSFPVIERVEENKIYAVSKTTGKKQRLVHSTLSKWWNSDGREQKSKRGDQMRCFDHFYGMIKSLLE